MGASPDGRVLAGHRGNFVDPLPTVWSDLAGPTDLVIPAPADRGEGRFVSADSTVIIGLGSDPVTGRMQALWDAATGAVTTIPVQDSLNVLASSDGAVLGGSWDLGGVRRGYRWDAIAGVVDLGSAGPDGVGLAAISGDGSTMVGGTPTSHFTGAVQVRFY